MSRTKLAPGLFGIWFLGMACFSVSPDIRDFTRRFHHLHRLPTSKIDFEYELCSRESEDGYSLLKDKRHDTTRSNKNKSWISFRAPCAIFASCFCMTNYVKWSCQIIPMSTSWNRKKAERAITRAKPRAVGPMGSSHLTFKKKYCICRSLRTWRCMNERI